MSKPESTARDDQSWLHTHVHEPNPQPPSPDASFELTLPDGEIVRVAPADLASYPRTTVADCWIVSTGHGASGPFTFGGVRLMDLIRAHLPSESWTHVDVVSDDGFGNRILAEELSAARDRPFLVADLIDGRPLTREEGLVRLIAPDEIDDALRQVKWIAQIQVRHRLQPE